MKAGHDVDTLAYAYGEGHNKTAVASMAITLASVLRIKPMN